MRIWDPANGTQLRQFDTDHTAGVDRVHIASDGSFLVAIGSTAVSFWPAWEGRRAAIRHGGGHQSSAPSSRGRLVLMGGPRGLSAYRLISDK
ncbi:hypothetical protein Pa4123_58630 [Phytohabitans aurantiacus]|uniref:Anaphase-promoting complex subunit 4 WD40 domain-containing protein n=1 Tax=Phytohabitans aurantiacus TaxID=3016789 RepID=A0ABQ5R199_9ACTN|nr:hypothetical protein Pa4123_58630 [Phytohabitans aurantiacus]